MKLKKNDKVMVFQKWITREKQEGIATLHNKCGKEPNSLAERWTVIFLDEPEATYYRTVWPEDKIVKQKGQN